jgi:hypothetical protein
MLTAEQRAELEERGADNIRAKLASYGGGYSGTLNGFLPSGSPVRGDVEDWLAERSRIEAARQRATLCWAKVAAWAAIASVLVTAIGIALTIK